MRNWKSRTIWLAVLLCALSTTGSGLTLTLIRDVLYNADGSKAQGGARISWKAFTAADGSTIAANSIEVKVIDGVIEVGLAPNEGSQPDGTSYEVSYRFDNGNRFHEIWIVPSSATAVTVSDVRATLAPTPGMVIAQSQVTGLTAALGAKADRDLSNTFTALQTLREDVPGSSNPQLKFETNDGAFSIGFRLPALASSTVYAWPNSDGLPGQQLTTDGGGLMFWSAAGSGAGTGTAYEIFQQGGASVTQRTVANFTNGFLVTDNAASTRTDLQPLYGTSAGTITEGDDPRLSDARQPLAHASTHAGGGSDPVTPLAIDALNRSNDAMVGTSLTTPVLKLQGMVGQSAAIQEWRDGNGALLGLVTPDGSAFFNEMGLSAKPGSTTVSQFFQLEGLNKFALSAVDGVFDVIRYDDFGVVKDRPLRVFRSGSVEANATLEVNDPAIGTGKTRLTGEYIEIDEAATPSAPASGAARLFADSATGEVSVKNSAGDVVSLERLPNGSGAPAAPDCSAATVGDAHLDVADGGTPYWCLQTGAGVYSWKSTPDLDPTTVANTGSGLTILTPGSNVQAKTVVGGAGIAITDDGSQLTWDLDSAVVAQLGGDNIYTASNDFSVGQLRLPSGFGAPVPADCTATAVGRTYVDANLGGEQYVCLQQSAGVYAWRADLGDEITSAATFSGGRRLIRGSATPGREVEESGVTLDASDNMTVPGTFSAGTLLAARAAAAPDPPACTVSTAGSIYVDSSDGGFPYWCLKSGPTSFTWSSTPSLDPTAVTNSGTGAAVLKTGTNVEARTLVAGLGVTVTAGADDINLAIDTAVVAQLGAANSFTGNNSFSGANSFTADNDFTAANLRAPNAAGAPAGGECSAATVGRIRIDSGAGGKAYVCLQDASSSHVWVALGGSRRSRFFPVASLGAAGAFAPCCGWALPTAGPTIESAGSGAYRVTQFSFADSQVDAANLHWKLPAEWGGGAISLEIEWRGTALATAGEQVNWQISTVCVGAGESIEAPTFNAAQTVTDTFAVGDDVNLRAVSLASLTTTGCSAGERIVIRAERDGVTDTLTGAARLMGVALTWSE